MTIQHRINLLEKAGIFLSQFRRNEPKKIPGLAPNEELYDRLKEQVEMAVHYNGWYTQDNVLFSLEEWSKALKKENLEKWLKNYTFTSEPKTVAIIMAGNIPLVGFHDFISVFVSGHKALIKQSSNDQKILPIIADYLISQEPEIQGAIEFSSGMLSNFDAVIATGSNNTARYFEYYFSSKPSIIRKNRNSAAVLTGKESPDQLTALGEDIFRYFGLGCRSVAKLFVPEGYDFHNFFEAIQPWENLMQHAKYANNYDYNKAVYLMSEFKILDNGFLILKEDENFGSPIGTIFYETYSDEAELKLKLENNRENIQCVVSNNFFHCEVNFGNTQHPQLSDYADNVDTLAFLESI